MEEFSDFFEYFENQWIKKKFYIGEKTYNFKDLVDYDTIYKKMGKKNDQAFRVTNNAVEAYNKRITQMFGAVKKPFSQWVKDICGEIEDQERLFEIRVFGKEKKYRA